MLHCLHVWGINFRENLFGTRKDWLPKYFMLNCILVPATQKGTDATHKVVLPIVWLECLLFRLRLSQPRAMPHYISLHKLATTTGADYDDQNPKKDQSHWIVYAVSESLLKCCQRLMTKNSTPTNKSMLFHDHRTLQSHEKHRIVQCIVSNASSCSNQQIPQAYSNVHLWSGDDLHCDHMSILVRFWCQSLESH